MSNFKNIAAEELSSNSFKLIGDDWLLITAEKDGKVNTMTASWGGLGVLWGKKVAYIVIRPQRYTKEFVDSSTHFSLTFFDSSYKDKLQYIGSVSGRKEDKIAKASLTVRKVNDTPFFEEASVAMICKKLYAQDLKKECFLDSNIPTKWYPNNDFHMLYVAEIESVLIK